MFLQISVVKFLQIEHILLFLTNRKSHKAFRLAFDSKGQGQGHAHFN